MLIDSNLIIHAVKPEPEYKPLRHWMTNNATHYSVISRLETLGWSGLGNKEAGHIQAILNNLACIAIDDAIIERAIELRRRRKVSLGDTLIAATCLVHQLPLATNNTKDFDWMGELEVHNPMS